MLFEARQILYFSTKVNLTVSKPNPERVLLVGLSLLKKRKLVPTLINVSRLVRYKTGVSLWPLTTTYCLFFCWKPLELMAF